MYSDLFNAGLAVFDKARDVLRGAKANSLIDYTGVARVEPIVLIDNAVMHYDCIGEVQRSLLSIFSGYYLQAAALQNTVGAINVNRHLEALNPARNAGDSVLAGNSWLLAKEAYADGLPFPGDVKQRLATEALVLSNESQEAEAVVSGIPKGDVNKTLSELANLSVGMMYGVEISNGDAKLTIPVAIRLIASTMGTNDLIHILSTGRDDNSWKERWHGFKSGRLTAWKDMILCQDIIDQHRRDLMNDPSGVRSKINKVQRGNQLATIVTGNPTIASSSNMVVTNIDTIHQLELQLEGKVSNFQIREKMFKNTYLMIMVVIDEDFRRVTFYHRGISLPTVIRLADLKASNKGNGPDVAEILKAYQMGNAPSL